MEWEELKYLIAFSRIQGLGLIQKKILLEEFGSAKFLFEELKDISTVFIKRNVIQKILQFNE